MFYFVDEELKQLAKQTLMKCFSEKDCVASSLIKIYVSVCIYFYFLMFLFYLNNLKNMLDIYKVTKYKIYLVIK